MGWRDEVYEAGRYGIGPDYTFRCYPLNVQNFNERLSVWSKSSGSDAGSTVYLDVSYQYLLKPERLGELYSMVALNFEVLEIENDADAVAKKATASASKIKENAVTEADEKVEVARLQGLKDLYDELGFTSEKHKASLDYLLTLMASSSNKEYVAFDSMGKVTTI